MTFYTELAPDARYLVAGILFITSILQLGLCIYRYVNIGDLRKCITDIIIYAVIFAATVICGGALNGQTVRYDIRIPWFVIVITIIFLIIYIIISLKKEYEDNKKRLSPISIKQAFDNLNSGIFFAGTDGRIVLINYKMGDIISSVIGDYPQTISEIHNALSGVEKYNVGENSYIFPDGSVWSFKNTELDKEDFAGYTQITALDITDLCRANELLDAENDRLKNTNEELKKMMERLSEHIREKETLDLKIKVHNDIGTSLIAIAGMINGGETEDNSDRLELLKNAVSYMSNRDRKKQDTIEEVIEYAKGLKVAVNIIGDLPEKEAYKNIIALAIRESVTNCIYHAHGNILDVYIDNINNSEYGASYIDNIISGIVIRIINNGIPPAGEITEGGGLTSLRKVVESAGGKMYIEYEPVFGLVVIL